MGIRLLNWNFQVISGSLSSGIAQTLKIAGLSGRHFEETVIYRRRNSTQQRFSMAVSSVNAIRLTLEQRTTYRFSIISKRLVDCLAEMHQSKYGLSINGWKVMSVIGRFGPLAAFEVGKFVSLDPDKVTRTVELLVKQSYVLRKQDSKDRRRISLSLSARGKRVHDDIETVRYAMEREFLSVLGPAELTNFYAVMDKLDAQARDRFGSRGAWKDIVGKYSDIVKISESRSRK
jgi:DNA-binding MarR family transcriptional regulator